MTSTKKNTAWEEEQRLRRRTMLEKKNNAWKDEHCLGKRTLLGKKVNVSFFSQSSFHSQEEGKIPLLGYRAASHTNYTDKEKPQENAFAVRPEGNCPEKKRKTPPSKRNRMCNKLLPLSNGEVSQEVETRERRSLRKLHCPQETAHKKLPTHYGFPQS
jgi:hypothetical protein